MTDGYTIAELAARAGMPNPTNRDLNRLAPRLVRFGWRKRRQRTREAGQYRWHPASPDFDVVPGETA